MMAFIFIYIALEYKGI